MNDESEDNWSDLEPGILLMIAKCLSFEKFISFRRVCKSWRLAAEKNNYESNIPWLMLSPIPNDTNFRSFFSLGNRTTYKIFLPAAYGKLFCLSSQGWLLTVTQDRILNLVHPLTRSQIRLPKLKNIRQPPRIKPCKTFDNFITKTVFSSEPSENSDFVVMIIYGDSRSLAFWKPSNWVWTGIDECALADITFYNQKFYAINCWGKIFECDISDPNSIAAKHVTTFTEDFREISSSLESIYLVESEGSLFVVFREGVGGRRAIEEGCGTYGFRVFMVDFGSGKWKEVKDLGDRVLFLGSNSSFSIRASWIQGCKGNCIYFSYDYGKCYWFKGKAGRNMGIYHMVDGTIELPFNAHQCVDPISAPTWIVPSYGDEPAPISLENASLRQN